MAVEFEVNDIGFKEIEKALLAFDRKTARRVANAAMRKELKPVASMANALWPGSNDNVFRISPRTVRGQLLTGGRAGPSEVRMFVGANRTAQGAPQAHLVEFGTGPRFHKSGKYTGIMPAQPMLQPAWDAYKGKFLRGLGVSLWAEIEKAIARAK